MPRRARMLFAALLLVSTPLIAQAAAPGYHILKKIPIGGDGGWDYLTMDSVGRRLYVARSNRVMVIDVDAGTLVGEIPNTPGVHGVALVPQRNRGFTSNGGEGTVTVFDLMTLKETARIKVGQGPDAIFYDQATGRVYTCNGRSRDLTAIDAETEKVVGTVKLDARPETGLGDGKGRLFVNLEDKNEIAVIDGRNLKLLQRWPLKPGETPTGLAFDPAAGVLFSSCRSGHMIVMDAESGKVIASPKIGAGTDAAAYDPETGLAFCSNNDGTANIVQKDAAGKYETVESVPTQAGAKTMALDLKTHNILLAAAKPKAGQRRSYEPGSFTILVVGK
jgi:DNA-binding beta-propeller fold protein YncE